MKDSELTKKYGPKPERKAPHKDYPKAMYRGDAPAEEVLSVEDEDAEKEAKKQGWRNHGEKGGKA
jgi:hypothetical protein